MGIGGVCTGQSCRRRQESAHSSGTCGVRRSWYERVRAVATEHCAGSRYGLDTRRRPLLEAHVMAALTAGEVVARIKANVGVPWRDATYRDTYKFGGADTEVTGIA